MPPVRLSPRRLGRRTIESFREGGLREVLWQTLAMAGARRLEIHCRGAECEPAPPVAGMTVRLLSAGDADAHRELRPFPPITRSEFSRRLRAGDLCIGAWQGGRLVGVCWLALNKAVVAYLGVSFALAPDTGYIYEVYTARDERHRGIGSLLDAAARDAARAAGRTRVLSGLLPDNAAAAALIRESVGPLGAVTSMRIGPRRIVRSSLPPGYTGRVRPLPHKHGPARRKGGRWPA